MVAEFLPELRPVGVEALGEGIVDGLAPAEERFACGSLGEALPQVYEKVLKCLQGFAPGFGKQGSGFGEPFGVAGDLLEEAVKVFEISIDEDLVCSGALRDEIDAEIAATGFREQIDHSINEFVFGTGSGAGLRHEGWGVTNGQYRVAR